ncbi:protein kinase [Entomophthora muscae]|uniref:Protein kinase n=1 Tax=Entomophthora muscae TaxID=34485 RepID=A0ACC2UK65_9FUNG|nr:protein kinase [Entomophthora muscae]
MDEENIPPPGTRKNIKPSFPQDAFKVKWGQNLKPLKRTSSQVEPERRRVKVRGASNFKQHDASKPLISEPVQRLNVASYKDALYELLEQQPVPLLKIIQVIVEGVLIAHWSVYFSHSIGEDVHSQEKPIHILSLGLEIVVRHAISKLGYQQKLGWDSAEKLVPLVISLLTIFNTKSICHNDLSIFYTLDGIFENIRAGTSFEHILFEIVVGNCNSDPVSQLPALCVIAADAPDSGYWRTEARTERHVVALESYYIKGNSSELIETSSFEEKRYKDYIESHLKDDLKTIQHDLSFTIHPEEIRFMLVNPTWKNLPSPIPTLAEDAARSIWKPAACSLNAFHGNLIIDPYSSDVSNLMHREIKRLSSYKPCNKKPEVTTPCARSRGQSATLYIGDSEVEVLKKIGQGSFGRVFKVIHAGKAKVLKIQKSTMAIREFYILNQVQQRHSAILGDFYTGITLLAYINAAVKSPGGLSETNVVLITKQLMGAVLSLHSMGILHNDIKLDNVLVDHTTNKPSVRLIDFGRSIDLRLLPPNAELVAIKPYMEDIPTDVQRLSPHQQDLGRPWIYHEDYFGMATVLYSLLTCRILETFRQVPSTDAALPPRFSPTPSVSNPRLSRPGFWNQVLDTLINSDLVVLERMVFRPKPALTSPSYRSEIQARFLPILNALIEKM